MAFFDPVEYGGEFVPVPLVLRRKDGEIHIVGRLGSSPDEDPVMVRVAADRILFDKEERRVPLHEGPPPFAASVPVNPVPGIATLSRWVRLRIRFGDAEVSNGRIGGAVRRAAVQAAGEE